MNHSQFSPEGKALFAQAQNYNTEVKGKSQFDTQSTLDQTKKRKSITHQIKSKMIHTLNSARGSNSSRKERNHNLNLSVDFASGGFKRSGTTVGPFGGNINNTVNDEEDE